MNKRMKPEDLFADFAHTPAEHFRLHFFGAVLVCIEYAAVCADSFDEALERFPFLTGYNNELAERLAGLSPHEALERWCVALAAWEAGTTVHLPLRALRALAGTDALGVMCLITAGLGEEDARFGAFFDALQGSSGQRRPAAGLLRQVWCRHLGAGDFSRLLRQARASGLLHSTETEGMLSDSALRIPPATWETLRGEACGTPVPWALWREADSLVPAEELTVTPETRRVLDALPRLFADGEARAVVVRGARHNGRRTLLGALARSMGRSLLELPGAEQFDAARWREAAALACLRHALPVACAEIAPGEAMRLPEAWPHGVPLGVVMGRTGGVTGELAADSVTLPLDPPDPEMRRAHWQRGLPSACAGMIAEMSARHRLGAGQIHRAARLARIRATIAGRGQPSGDDVLDALRTLNRESLDSLARRLPAAGDWSRLSAGGLTLRELQHLEGRCRHRERLPAMLDAVPAAGVRALFTGPSGTGKTHAARLLAAQLQKDIYQLDLSAVVNKYIGETEKNLHRVFEAAEELDVILLLDEGDALLGQRTDGQSANDRYANLETNFLLQRLESYQGILIVTTNARSRIDSAFERRMDVTVEFHAPGAEERWSLWELHLPAPHRVSGDFLNEVAERCEFTGGQIRNAALHAALLALDNGGVVKTATLESAIRREYSKQGAACPLRHFAETL